MRSSDQVGQRGARYYEYHERSCRNPAVLDELVRRIAERFSPDKIILFGSSARGDAGLDSDIDKLVLFSEVADPNKRAAELYASLVEFRRPMDNCRFDQFPFRTLPERGEYGVLAGLA